jgi:hypothetical protein
MANQDMIETPNWTPRQTSLVQGSIWMMVVSVVLFFLPGVNGFVGGVIGGARSGDAWSAFRASVLPALVTTILLWFVYAVFDARVLYFSNLSPFTLSLTSGLAMLLGALVGGSGATSRSATA